MTTQDKSAGRIAVETLTVGDLMHPTPYVRAFSSPGWIFEHTLDGIRTLVRRCGDQIDILSSRGMSLVQNFPEVVSALAMLPDRTVVDAELVVPDEFKSASFAYLRWRGRMRHESSILAMAAEHPAVLRAFDCLVLKDKDIRDRPLVIRKALMDRHFAFNQCVQAVTSVEELGVKAFNAAVAIGADGVLARKTESLYRAGRQLAWRVIRNSQYVRSQALSPLHESIQLSSSRALKSRGGKY